ncbi:MAG: YcxB family protein [Armatimonadetes bacterium]|nr:YcxB family protein [Armatimonadota bacterium]
MAMKFEFQYREDDYVEAQELHTRFGRFARWGLPAMALAGLALVLFHGTRFFYDDESEYYRLLYLLLGLFLMLYPLLSTRSLRMQMGRLTNLQDKFSLELGDEGLLLVGPNQQTELRWEALERWREGNDVILLFCRPGMFTILPKRAMSAEHRVQLRELLDQHISDK